MAIGKETSRLRWVAVPVFHYIHGKMLAKISFCTGPLEPSLQGCVTRTGKSLSAVELHHSYFYKDFIPICLSLGHVGPWLQHVLRNTSSSSCSHNKGGGHSRNRDMLSGRRMTSVRSKFANGENDSEQSSLLQPA